MKRFKKVYIEISNICNLSCSFCPGTKRAPKIMEPDEFKTVITKVAPFTDYVYFHLLGEPLLHPNLKDYLNICEEHGIERKVFYEEVEEIKKNIVEMLDNPYYNMV